MNIEVLIGKQVDMSTDATTFTRLSARDVTLAPTVNTVSSEAFSGSRFAKDGFVSRVEVGGGMPLEISRDVLMMLLEGAGFDFTTSAQDKIGKVADKIDDFFTVVVNYKDEQMHEKFSGCQINTIDIGLATESYVLSNVEFIGIKSEPVASLFTGTIKNPTETDLICLDTKVEYDGADVSGDIESLTFSIDNGLEARAGINSVYTTSIRSSNASATLDITYNGFDKTRYINADTAMKTNTKKTAKITLGVNGGGENDIVLIDIPNLKVSGNDKGDLGGAGSLSQTFNCYFDNTENTIAKFTFKGMVG